MSSEISYKTPIRLNTKFNSEGQEVEVEIREDAEQKELLQDIFNLLIEAGYFRANFKELSSFDKLAGGMIWCIYTSKSNVNIGLPFGYGEQLNIGKKIFLSENIIKVLLSPSMKCPVTIQPHQIMGLDVVKILPLMKWLVEESKKYREVNFEDFHRVALKYFNKHSSLSSDQEREDLKVAVLKNIFSVLSKYLPVRKYKRKTGKPAEDSSLPLAQHEYISVVYKDNKADERNAFISKFLTETTFEEEKLFDFCKQKENHYNLLNDEIFTSSLEAELLTENKKKSETETLLRLLEEEKEKIFLEVATLDADLEQIQTERQNLVSEICSIEEEYREQKQECDEIHNLIVETKSLREEFSKLNAINQAKNDDLYLRSTEEDDALQEQEEQKLIKDLNVKIEKITALLAAENKQIVELELQLDEPDSAEMAMYQKRFHELYDEVAANTIETKQFFDLYNTLIDTKHYVSKEINLLNSVLDNYQRAMSSANYRDQFFNQLESIVEWVKQTKSKVTQKLGDVRVKRHNLSKELSSLLELEREYAMVVGQLSMEVTTRAHKMGKLNYQNYT